LNGREEHDIEREGREGENGPGILEMKSKEKNGEAGMESKRSNAKAVKETYEDPPICSKSPSNLAMES
jgi:hypothetical protein